MGVKPPKPLCPTFVLCRRIFNDRFSNEAILLSPVYEVHGVSFPALIDLAVYFRLSDGNGSYQLSFQMYSAEGPRAWSEPLRGKIELPNPLATAVLEIPMVRVYFPYPGKFEMLLLANDEEIYRTDLIAKPHEQKPPPLPPPAQKE